MNATARTQPESDKGEIRRQQVLDAATECFRREGFHGSSIARISQAAGMSPGHIYHYFANKEAIVEAIAAREENDMAELVRKVEEDRSGGDLATRLTRHVAESIDHSLDPARAGLMLELAAEAARNPAVRKILERSDQAIAARFFDLVERLGPPPGLDEAELHARMEMIAVLFNGLVMRSLCASRNDRATTARLVKDLIGFLLRTDK